MNASRLSTEALPPDMIARGMVGHGPLALLLLVDDVPESLQQLTAILAEQFRVYPAATGDEALKFIVGKRPEAVLVHMPLQHASAEDLCRSIRSIPGFPNLPIVAIFDKLDDANLLAAFQARVDDFLYRASDPELIRFRILAVIHKTSPHRPYRRNSVFESLFSPFPDGILILNSSSTILMANTQMVEMLGLESATELVGRPLSDFVHDLLGGDDRIQELSLKRGDGRTLIAEVSNGRPAPGRVIGSYTMVFRDITQRKRTEEALERRQMEVDMLERVARRMTENLDLDLRLQALADAIVDLLPNAQAASVWLMDAETSRLAPKAWRTHADEDMRNLSVTVDNALVGMVAAARRPINIADTRNHPFFVRFNLPALDEIRSVVAVPIFMQTELVGVLCADNLSSTAAFTDDDVRLLKSLANHADIVIRNARLYQELQKQAKELEERVARRTAELASERDLRQAILEAMDDAVIVTDTDDIIQYTNPAAKHFTGRSASQLVGQKGLPLDGQTNAEANSVFWQPPASRRSIRRLETRSAGPNGKQMDISVTILPLSTHAANDNAGAVTVFRDVTEVREAERLKDRFVSNVSHELRSPLSVILLLTVNLEKHYERMDDGMRQRLISKVVRQAEILTSLLGDILEMSRIDSGRFSADWRRIDLARALAAEVRRLKPLARQRLHTLTKTAASSVWVRGDEEQLRLVMRNLLDNAFKYTPPEGEIIYEARRISGGVSDPDWPDSGNLPARPWARRQNYGQWHWYRGIAIEPDIREILSHRSAWRCRWQWPGAVDCQRFGRITQRTRGRYVTTRDWHDIRHLSTAG